MGTIQIASWRSNPRMREDAEEQGGSPNMALAVRTIIQIDAALAWRPTLTAVSFFTPLPAFS
jgi:hypothetical protein